MLVHRLCFTRSRLVGLVNTRQLLQVRKRPGSCMSAQYNHQSTPSTGGKSYEDAIALLNSRRRSDRPKAADKLTAPRLVVTGQSGTPDLRGRPSINGMQEWLAQLGYSAADINRLNIIHVAGTKGKGSTCAFIESFIRTYGKRTGFPRRTGLYTSPHLKHPEERIRIDFEPISRELFAKYFFEVWEALCIDSNGVNAPRYLQLYALISFHAFIKEGVEVAIYETHHGGEYDATNVITEPIVTAIATLGMDHVDQLGPGIENIAWHKAGIMKAGALCVAAPQEPAAASVLERRAREKGTSVRFVDPATASADIQVVQPSVQRINCTLAISAVNSFLDTKSGAQLSPADIQQGIAEFRWPGRFQHLTQGSIQWYLDSAHNDLSMSQAADWFAQATRTSSSDTPKVLIFSHLSNARDAQQVVKSLAQALHDRNVALTSALFTTYIPSESTPKEEYPFYGIHKREEIEHPRLHLETYAEPWHRFDDKADLKGFVFIEDAMKFVSDLDEASGGNGVQVLVTGSQFLVGGVLRLMDEVA